MDLDFVSVHKHAKKELGQYPAILTSRLVNNPYILTEPGTEQTWSITHIWLSEDFFSSGTRWVVQELQEDKHTLALSLK